MNGLTTGNTWGDLSILVLLPLLALLAQRYGLTEMLARLGDLLSSLRIPQTQIPPRRPDGPVAPVFDDRLEVAEVRREPVALEWIALIQLLLPLILQAIELFRSRTGRAPTAREVVHIQREIVARYRRGELPDDLAVVLPGQTVPLVE